MKKQDEPAAGPIKAKKQQAPMENQKLMPTIELTQRDESMGFVVGGVRSLEESMMEQGEFSSLNPPPLPDTEEPPGDHIDKVRTQLKDAFPDLTDAELEAEVL